MISKTNNVIGSVYNSKRFGNYEVIEYKNWSCVKIRFKNTGYEYYTTLQNIKNSEVKDKSVPTVYGVGILGDKYPTRHNGKSLSEYQLWNGMLERCYSSKWHNKKPTYKDCTVSENFTRYEYFYEWCQKQKGFRNEKWHLDKDLLIKGNKVYSEDICVFLPPEINTALLNCKSNRSELPIGVFLLPSGRYQVQCSINGKHIYLGSFDTVEEAFYKYKVEKELYLKRLAFKWGEKLDPRAERALYTYKIEIDD